MLSLAPAVLLSAASLALGSPTNVYCAEPGRWQEVISAYAPHLLGKKIGALGGTIGIFFPERRCRKLVEISEGRVSDEKIIAYNLMLFGHELGHAQGVRDENYATCAGIYMGKRLAAGLNLLRPIYWRRKMMEWQKWSYELKYVCPDFPRQIFVGWNLEEEEDGNDNGS